MQELRKIKTQQDCTSVMHLHVFKRKDLKYLILSESSDLEWDEFLEQAIINTQVRRFVEISCDEFGIERVIRDFIR